MPDLLQSKPANCDQHIPWGQPDVPGHIQSICFTGYISYFDTDLKVPRLVAYRETGPDTLGCLDRLRNFHTERTLGPGRPSPGDYKNSGYDLGHNAPDQDMATTYVRLFDSYNLVNVSPQLPGMNRQGWESLEELVRAWALEHGEVIIYVGSIPHPKPDAMAESLGMEVTPTIGRNRVSVPQAFYKVVVDPKTNASAAFIMPNADIQKGDVTPYTASITEIEQRSGIHLPLPDGVPRTTKLMMGGGDVSAWHKAHKASCKADITTIPGGTATPDMDNAKPMPLPSTQ